MGHYMFSFLILLSHSTLLLCSDIDLTVDIPAGRQECFWQELPESTNCEIDYQVIDGGDMDISVYVSGPDERILFMEQRKTENVIKFKSERKGDYKVCFDNSFSTFSNKVVFFEIFIEDGRDSDDEDEDSEHRLAMREDYKAMESQLDMTVDQFLGILDRSKKNLERSVQVQTLIRMHEAKDRNTQEANFFRVNFFSCFQLAVMMVVGLGQVLMIRSLFQERRSGAGSAVKART